jgi:hypothetical protein
VSLNHDGACLLRLLGQGSVCSLQDVAVSSGHGGEATSSYFSRRARNSSTSDDVIAQSQAPPIPEYHHTRCQRMSVKVSAYTATAVTADATAARTSTNARPRTNTGRRPNVNLMQRLSGARASRLTQYFCGTHQRASQSFHASGPSASAGEQASTPHSV